MADTENRVHAISKIVALAMFAGTAIGWVREKPKDTAIAPETIESVAAVNNLSPMQYLTARKALNDLLLGVRDMNEYKNSPKNSEGGFISVLAKSDIEFSTECLIQLAKENNLGPKDEEPRIVIAQDGTISTNVKLYIQTLEQLIQGQSVEMTR